MKKRHTKLHYFTLEFIAVSQKSFWKSEVIVFLFFFLKFIGLVIYASSLEIFNANDLNVTLCNIFRLITYFNRMKRDNITLVNYEFGALFLYVVILLPLVIFLFLLWRCPASSSNWNVCATQITMTSTYKLLATITAYILLLLAFLSQHLIEYLLFPIILLLPSTVIEDSALSSRLMRIKTGMRINPIALLSLGCFFVVLVNAYVWFVFKYYNRPFLSKTFINKFTFNDYFFYLLLVAFNFQGFHFLLLIGNIIKYVFTGLAFALSVILILFAMNRFIERTRYNYLILSFIYFAVFSSILSLSLFFPMNRGEDKMGNGVFLAKFIVEVIFVFLSHYALMNIQDEVLNKAIRDNLSIKTKNVKGDYLYQLTELLKLCINDSKHFVLLFSLLESSQTKPTAKPNSPSEGGLELISYFDKLKQEKKLNLNKEHIRMLFKEKYDNILVLIEAEIISHIYNLFCNKKIIEEIRIPLLHCDFISHFKLNYSFSLYLIQEYLSKIPMLSFEATVYFFFLKQFILSEREKRLKQNQDNTVLHVKFGNFINYFEVIEEIKSHLLLNCGNYQQIISMKNVYSEMKSHQESRQFNADLEVLFENCMKIETSMHKMELTIKEHFSANSLKNPEIVFLITNFYEITQKKVPEDIKDSLIDIKSYEDISRFDSSFLDQGFDHPMILTLSSKNSFDARNLKVKSTFCIYYVSQKLMNALGYKKSDLIGKDYNILLPRMFAEAHSIEFKRVFFIHENFHMNNSQFILSKEGYYVKIRETSGIIPTLKNDTIVIVNIAIDPIDKNSFLFITDINMNIVTITKNFETTFQLNYEMIKRLGITFSGLFNINNDKILADFNEEIRAVIRNSIDSIDSQMTIMTNNSYENILSAYRIKVSKEKILSIRLNKRKRKLCSALQKIRKQIEEEEYDTDWMMRIIQFEKLCRTDKSESSFDIVLALKNLGNVPYFFIKVIDREEVSGTVLEQSSHTLVFNKLSGINDLSQGDYTKKYNECYQKSSFNQSLRKSPKTKDSSLNYTSNTMNETNQQLLSTHKKFIPSHSTNNSRSLIQKLNINFEKEKQRDIDIIIQLKQRETICTMVLFVLMGGMSICFIINFFIKSAGIQVVKDSSDLIFNIVKLKEAILESAMLLSSGCYQLDDLEPNPYHNVDFTPEMIKAQLFVRGAEMFSFFNNFNEYLKSHIHIPEIGQQLSFIKAPMVITSLNADFNALSYKATFSVELNYFHFHCGYMRATDSLIKCGVRDHFLGGVRNEKGATASDDEVFFYYTTQNILVAFMTKIDLMINQSSLYIFNKTTETGTHFLDFNVAMLIIALGLLFTFICLIIIYKQRIVSYLKVFIVKSEKTIIIEKKLQNFRTVLISFDHEVCEVYEMTKEKINSFNAKDMKKTHQLSQLKHKSKKDSTSAKTAKNESKKGKEEEYNGDDHFNANTMRVFSLKILTKALLLFLVSLCIFMGIIIGNIVTDTSLFSSLLVTTETAFSYLDHNPSLNELLFYYRVSILNGNADFLTLQRSEYNSMMYNYRFANAKVNMDNDERFAVLGQSKMAFLYYRSFSESEVIEYYEANNVWQVLPLLKQYVKLINTEGIACEQFSSSYGQYVNDSQDEFDQPFLLHACMNLEGGNTNKGLLGQLNHFYTAVFDEYIDFVKNPQGDLADYSQGRAFISASKLMTFVYNVNWHIFVKILEEEMSNLFSKVSLLEVVFQIIELVMNFLFCAIYISFILGYLKLSIDRYGNIIERLKMALN